MVQPFGLWCFWLLPCLRRLVGYCAVSVILGMWWRGPCRSAGAIEINGLYPGLSVMQVVCIESSP